VSELALKLIPCVVAIILLALVLLWIYWPEDD
jgi:uncharacterized membrane protein YqiK